MSTSMERVIIRAEDGYRLCLHVFEVENARGYVQIIHGMEEHQERYEPFVQRLNAAGYTVISSDMRGHGRTAPVLGYFGEEKGDYYLLADQVRITAYIRYRFHVEKVIIFAHSMGTIVARNLLQSQSERYEKIILSSYPCYHRAVGFGIFLTNLVKRMKKGDYYSAFVQRMAIGSFNRKIPQHKTPLDWVSVNEDNVQAFIDDPYCGHGFRIAGFHDLFTLVRNMNRVKRYRKVQSDLPILTLCGADDPCVGGKRGSESSLLTLRRAGFNNVTSICYPKMRHEILHEKNNEKVYADILDFLARRA